MALVVPTLVPTIEMSPEPVAVMFWAPEVGPIIESPDDAVEEPDAAAVTIPEISIAGEALEPVVIVEV